MPRLLLRIEVNVDAPHGTSMSPYVNDALQDVINRQAFRTGSFIPGRQLDYLDSVGDVRVTVDMMRVIIETKR